MNNRIIKIQSILLLMACLFQACSSDELNSQELMLYVKAGGNNVISNTIVHTPTGSVGNQSISLNIRSTRPVYADASAVFSANELLIDTYNEENNSNYVLLPATAYTLSNSGNVTLKIGEQKSTDELQLEIADLTLLSERTGYILPLQMSSLTSSDKGVEISANYNTVYITFDIAFLNIDNAATTVEGTFLPTDNWTARFTDNTDITSDIFDDDINTGWNSGWGGEPAPLVIDMQSSQSIIGFRFAPRYMYGGSYTMTQKKVKVETSNDQETWDAHGIAELPQVGGSPTAPEYQFIKFYGAVSCRYVRLTFIEKWSYYYGISECKFITE